MIVAEHQRNEYGTRALDLVVERARSLPGRTRARSSFVPGEAGPREFYLRYGFVETSEIHGGEHVIRFEL